MPFAAFVSKRQMLIGVGRVGGPFSVANFGFPFALARSPKVFACCCFALSRLWVGGGRAAASMGGCFPVVVSWQFCLVRFGAVCFPLFVIVGVYVYFNLLGDFAC